MVNVTIYGIHMDPMGRAPPCVISFSNVGISLISEEKRDRWIDGSTVDV